MSGLPGRDSLTAAPTVTGADSEIWAVTVPVSPPLLGLMNIFGAGPAVSAIVTLDAPYVPMSANPGGAVMLANVPLTELAARTWKLSPGAGAKLFAYVVFSVPASVAGPLKVSLLKLPLAVPARARLSVAPVPCI